MNPALTAMANSLRVGDHLLERLGVPAAVSRADRRVIPPSGEQFEIVCGDQRAVVVEVGGGLRILHGRRARAARRLRRGRDAQSGRGQVLVPWPNRIEDGRYEFDGRRAPAAARPSRARERDPRSRAVGGLDSRVSGSRTAW